MTTVLTESVSTESNDDNGIMEQFKSIDEQLNNLVTMEGIYGVILFRIDGLVINTKFSVEINQSLLEITAWINNIVKKVSVELREDIEGINYAKKDYTVHFYKCGCSGILSCVINAYANTGLLAIEMDKVAGNIESLLERSN